MLCIGLNSRIKKIIISITALLEIQMNKYLEREVLLTYISLCFIENWYGNGKYFDQLGILYYSNICKRISD